MVNQLIITIVLWYLVGLRPKRMFSYHRVKQLFSYGWKLLVASLIDTLYRDLRSIIIGRMYNAEMLGFYNRGRQFPQLIVGNIDHSIQAVLFPVLSSQQDERERLKAIMRRGIVTSSFIIFPLMALLAVLAEPLVILLLTEKWLPSVPFLQISCAVFALYPIHTANLQAINAVGRSDIFLKLEIVKKIVGLSILGVTVFNGIYAIALGGIVSGVISSFINAYPNKKLLSYSYKEQLKDVMPSFVLSGFMGAIVYTIGYLSVEIWQVLLLQGIVGVFIYVGLSKVLKFESYRYLQMTIRKSIRIRKKKV